VSFVWEAAAAEEEIAVGVNETPVDGFDLPPDVTSGEFSLYVAMDADVQTVAEVTDEELCAGQQATGDVDTDVERISEDTGEADDSRHQRLLPAIRYLLVTLSNALLCLDTVRAYMEMDYDSDSYERLYGSAGDCYCRKQ